MLKYATKIRYRRDETTCNKKTTYRSVANSILSEENLTNFSLKLGLKQGRSSLESPSRAVRRKRKPPRLERKRQIAPVCAQYHRKDQYSEYNRSKNSSRKNKNTNPLKNAINRQHN